MALWNCCTKLSSSYLRECSFGGSIFGSSLLDLKIGDGVIGASIFFSTRFLFSCIGFEESIGGQGCSFSISSLSLITSSLLFDKGSLTISDETFCVFLLLGFGVSLTNTKSSSVSSNLRFVLF